MLKSGMSVEMRSAKRQYEEYCRNCTINDSCVAICQGKWNALVRINELSKGHFKSMVTLPSGAKKILPFWE